MIRAKGLSNKPLLSVMNLLAILKPPSEAQSLKPTVRPKPWILHLEPKILNPDTLFSRRHAVGPVFQRQRAGKTTRWRAVGGLYPNREPQEHSRKKRGEYLPRSLYYSYYILGIPCLAFPLEAFCVCAFTLCWLFCMDTIPR